MAKKKRKDRQPNLPPEVLAKMRAQVGDRAGLQPKSASEAPAETSEGTSQPQANSIDLAAEYRYVVADLQRIGLLSILVLVALVAVRLISG